MTDRERRERVANRFRIAQERLDDARLLLERGSEHGAVNRLYYACLAAVSAVLLDRGVTVGSHTSARGQFGLHIVKPGMVETRYAALFRTLSDLRSEVDYDDFPEIQFPEVERLAIDTGAMIAALHALSREGPR